MDINKLQTFEVNGKKCVALIRKLTERECGRLMDVDDEYIDIIQNSGVSRTSQYKMYGNSIVVNVLFHMMRKCFIPGQRDNESMQMDLFSSADEYEHPTYDHEHPLRVVTLCSGYDSQCLALERLKKEFPPFDYELVAWSEFDPESNKPIDEQPAVIAHKALFPQWADRNLGDMTKVDWNTLPDFDLAFYSTPCVTEESLILTDKGYKQMRDIEEGDVVLTKSNTLHKVLKKFDNGVHPTCILNATGFENLRVTYNHKFYVREMYRHGHKWVRDFKQPEFVEAKNLTRNHYFGFPVNEESIPFITEDTDFWYMVGYYIGDGWLPSRENDNNIILACNDTKFEKLSSALDKSKWKWTLQRGKTCDRLRFSNKEISKLIRDNFGTGCRNKRIPYNVVRMPREQLQAFFNGYLDSDGCKPYKNYVQFTTVNRYIAYTIQLIIAKLYHRVTSISKVNVTPTKVIQGRVVNQQPWYQIRAKIVDSKQDKAFYEDGYIWYPFISRTDSTDEHVYNIEVEEDHSYILQCSMSKNCQSISQAGLQHGFTEGSGTRSSIIWNVRDLLRIKKPRYACLENVAAMVSQKFLPMFNLWRKELDNLDYVSAAQLINSKMMGVPQNRERIFLWSIYDPSHSVQYNFPEPIPLKNRLKDLLEDVTDTKYYLNPIKTQEFVERNLIKIQEYAKQDSAEIEPLPQHLREWIENYKDDETEEPQSEDCMQP